MLTEQEYQIIEALARRMGVKGTYQGLRCLIWGVALVRERPELLMAVTKELYPEIARRVGGSGKTVERNLRTVARVCWEQGDRALLNEMAGCTLRDKPTAGELIDCMAHHLRTTGVQAQTRS